MIPKEKIEELRERASIVDVVGGFVDLRKKGANYMGLCPFHSEKTPSFSVSEDKKLFYCFGCHASGDAITFLMKKEGVDFLDAVRTLAGRYGLEIEEKRSSGPDPREPLWEANRAALEYFKGRLASPEGRAARGYLEDRGYDPAGELLGDFRVGFAPEGWDGLLRYLKGKSISEAAATRAGLLIRSPKTGRPYDRFRARLIFPIMDPKGRPCAFGGRSLDGSEPKYLNSPETPVFKKGQILYGMNLAKKSIMEKRSVIVVEGYFDLLALHGHGFTNTVATMGTALTPMHLRAFKSFTDRVYTLFDSDRAGRAASRRALELFVEEGVTARAVVLPRDQDPDDFLRGSGASAMAEALDRAEPLMEFYLKELAGDFDLKTPEGKGKYLDAAIRHLAKVRNVAERDHYAGSLASYLAIPVESVYEALRAGRSGVRGVEKTTPGARSAATTGKSGKSGKGNLKETTLLKVMLTHPELYNDSVEAAVEAFSDPALKEAGKAITALCRKGLGVNASSIASELTDERTRSAVVRLLVDGEEGFIEAPEKMLDDSLKGILGRGRPKDSTAEMIKRLEEAGHGEMAREMRRRLER